MNWYKKLAQNSDSILDIIYDNWKESSFNENVNTIIYRIYQIGVPADVDKKKLENRIEQVIYELAHEGGELNLWYKVTKDDNYFEKLKNSAKKRYRKKVKEIEKAKKGPLQINTPQTPLGPPGGGGGMLM
ncbi:MAG: hypothetical protein ACOCUI_00645 [bacterium]